MWPISTAMLRFWEVTLLEDLIVQVHVCLAITDGCIFQQKGRELSGLCTELSSDKSPHG